MPRKTDTREKILEYVRNTTQERGYAPSVREIMNAVGIKSPSTIHYHLRKLEEQGVLRTTKKICRSVVLTDQNVKSTANVAIPEMSKQYHSDVVTAEEAGSASTLSAMDSMILSYIRATIEERGYAPSFREIGKAVGLQSPSTVQVHLRKLQEQGLICMRTKAGRAITLI